MIEAIVDRQDTVLESNENNNTNGVQATFDPPIILLQHDTMVPAPGFGPTGWVAPGKSLNYSTIFENEGDSTGAVQDVTVTQTLDPNLDPSTLNLLGFGFDGLLFPIAAGQSSYHDVVTTALGFNVSVDVQLNSSEDGNTLVWKLVAIDPTTGEEVQDPQIGLLPSDDSTHDGEGVVAYTIRPYDSTPNQSVIDAHAQVIFNGGASTGVTNLASNTLDNAAPTTSVNVLPATESSSSFIVSWSGSDDTGGSGLSNYTIYVSDNGGAYTPFVSNVTTTSATFTGAVLGHSYSFYSVGKDHVGNIEAAPTTPDTTTLIATAGPHVLGIQFSNLLAPHRFTISFDENVAGSLAPASVIVQNLTAQTTLPSSSFDFAYDTATNVATFAYNRPGGLLPDGNYRVTLPAGSVMDVNGNSLAAAATYDFFVLSADANHDRTVNALDFNVLASHFGATNVGFAKGDFNYNGVVDTADFTLLAINFGTSIAPPPPNAALPGGATPLANLFGKADITHDDGWDLNSKSASLNQDLV